MCYTTTTHIAILYVHACGVVIRDARARVPALEQFSLVHYCCVCCCCCSAASAPLYCHHVVCVCVCGERASAWPYCPRSSFVICIVYSTTRSENHHHHNISAFRRLLSGRVFARACQQSVDCLVCSAPMCRGCLRCVCAVRCVCGRWRFCG